MSTEAYKLAVAIDTFSVPLRNLRASVDGTNLTLDLIPSLILDRPAGLPHTTGNDDVDDVLREMMQSSRPIVEGGRMFRAYFESVQACVVQEEFVELFGDLEPQSDSLPRMGEGRACFPFLRVENSAWRSRLPDYQGGDWPELQHYKIVSMETNFDVLGILVGTEWVRNSQEI